MGKLRQGVTRSLIHFQEPQTQVREVAAGWACDSLAIRFLPWALGLLSDFRADRQAAGSPAVSRGGVSCPKGFRAA